MSKYDIYKLNPFDTLSAYVVIKNWFNVLNIHLDMDTLNEPIPGLKKSIIDQLSNKEKVTYHSALLFASEHAVYAGTNVIVCRTLDRTVQAVAELLKFGDGSELDGSNKIAYYKQVDKVDSLCELPAASFFQIEEVLVKNFGNIYSSSEFLSTKVVGVTEVSLSEVVLFDLDSRLTVPTSHISLPEGIDLYDHVPQLSVNSVNTLYKLSGYNPTVKIPQNYLRMLQSNGTFNFGVINYVLTRILGADNFDLHSHFSKIEKFFNTVGVREIRYKDINLDIADVYYSGSSPEFRNLLKLIGDQSYELESDIFNKHLLNNQIVSPFKAAADKGYVSKKVSKNQFDVYHGGSKVGYFKFNGLDFSSVQDMQDIYDFYDFIDWTFIIYAYIVQKGELVRDGDVLSIEYLPVTLFTKYYIVSKNLQLVDKDKNPIEVTEL